MRTESERLREMLVRMYLIRHFELKVVELFRHGLIRGSTHVYLGEEAVAVGACAALQDSDYIVSTHRGHGHCLAKGGKPDKMMAELLGKETGYCRGRGGSMHIADFEIGILGANGIVGGGIPLAAGAGLSAACRESKQVTLCFFGDGASNQGSFHETLNLAAIWKLPVVFICENNLYAVTMPVAEAVPVQDIADRAASYGIPGVVIDGNDVLAVCEAVSEAVERARSGGGPTLAECKTYRYEGHYLGDPEIYRTAEEVAKWKRNDPVEKFRGQLLNEQVITGEEAVAIGEDAKRAVDAAEAFARDSPDPAVEAVADDVYYFGEPIVDELAPTGWREITYREALNEALREEMRRDNTVIILGEDVALHGGAFGVTKGLYQEFGSRRVRNTPVSETAIIGAGAGAALTGLRPVVEIMYMDFMTIGMDQIVNQVAKIRYMSGGKAVLPLVIRTQCGGGMGSAAQHSQSLEAWFFHVPGLKVVIPSTAYDVKGLLKAAIRENNPVIFIEYKRLYPSKGFVPEEEYVIPLGNAEIKREGEDITVVATSAMVPEALGAAAKLAEEGISIEVVDPRTLFPLDKDTIIRSVKKTGKLIIVHEACKRGGVGGEIAAIISDQAFDYLDAPIKRVAGMEVPMPYSQVLESAVIPDEDAIIAAVKESLA